MGDDGDPPYIRILLNQDLTFKSYFLVGDPAQGIIERIGVEPTMLMAHSTVLRQLLSDRTTELNERRDIPLPNIHPKTFKNMLRYAYGFNNIRNHSITDVIKLLKISDQLVMPGLQAAVIQHMMSILSPNNIHTVLQDSICLQNSNIEVKVAKIIRENTKMVLDSPDFYNISPAGLRYILLLESLPVSPAYVWRAVMKWARHIVSGEQWPSHFDRMELHADRLLLPSPERLRLCALNIIELVEFKEVKFPQLANYHFLLNEPTARLLTCTDCRRENRITHEEMEVFVVHDCSSWVHPLSGVASQVIISTAICALDVYSIVCMAVQQNSVEAAASQTSCKEHVKDDDFMYQNSCSVKIFCITGKEKKKELKSEMQIQSKMFFDETFEIPLSIRLESNSSYMIELTFSDPHPLWYANDTQGSSENSSSSSSLDVVCGVISKDNKGVGSHIKYILYKTLND